MSTKEIEIHERAVKLRKMTDNQLINCIERMIKKAEENSAKCFAHKFSEFIDEMKNVPGIGNTIMQKVNKLADKYK